MSKMALIAGVIVAVVVVAGIGFYFLSGPGGENPDETLSASINGSDYTYAEMAEKFGTKTVDGKDGVPLDAIVTDTGLANPDTNTFVLKSEDGFAMAVNWTVMQKGIVTMVEEEKDGNTITYLMSVFPGLPSAYKVKYLANIEPRTDLTPIVCNGLEYYLDYMPKRVEKKTITYNDTYAPNGWSLSDMVNYTGLADPQDHEYTIVGYDPTKDEPWYNKTVTWAGMMGGIVIGDDTRTIFDQSTEYASGRKYWVKGVVEIIVE